MREVLIEAKNVQAAVEKGVTELGLRRDQVEVVVKSEGSSGFLGIGSKPAMVLVREKKWRTEGSQERGERGSRPENRREGRQRGDKPVRSERSERSERGGGRDRKNGRRPQNGGGQRRGGNSGKSRRDDGFYSVNAETFEKIPLSTIAAQAKQQQAAAENAQQQPENSAQPEVAVPLVTIELKPIPQELAAAAENAKGALGEILSRMGVTPGDITMGWDPVQERIMMDFACDHPEIVIGKDGHTIEALQYLIILVISRKGNTPVAVQIDTGNYWRRIESGIIAGINRGVEEVERTGRMFRLEPMPPARRRFVHKMLAGSPKVETYSEGEGRWRKVVIKPRQQQDQPQDNPQMQQPQA